MKLDWDHVWVDKKDGQINMLMLGDGKVDGERVE